ncbi:MULTISPECIES: hypothetical protein [unclassified Wenzhouxiangella]|uniref:hypothetical protein n=1 Tax=unclassified Wenzhouxiangella TaxID=2613841 RepID=UPI000E328C45|nr:MULTISPECIES: hypothetical protein [unclassified Wenzhouxiangella]RFF26855.1 hypothetical protein DZK25_10855 [Wenzhouxiangella sp. 15181]RFP68491.1 hypothetical protein DZK26_07330 [Wenzhouxiangella sp. 15190]
MGICATCGNDYENTILVVKDGKEYEFDCFECAVQELAPVCGQCGVRVIGHGVEHEGNIFCGAHCAHRAGITVLVDHG